ncbi:hypothetical protein BGW36DRAFT_297726, partial [Talaromyces proteolyticus]
ELEASTCTFAELVSALQVSGRVIVRNILTPEEIRQVESDVRPWLDQNRLWDGDLFPPETRRAFGLVRKSKTLCITDSRPCEKNEASSSKPQQNNTVVFSTGIGAHDQNLHRSAHTSAAAARHELGRHAGIGFIVSGKKTARQNNSTRFIPGSHLWDYTDRPASEDKTLFAELNPGDGFIILSGFFHGGSANKKVNEEILLPACFYTGSWMRHEENQYLANDWEQILKLPRWLQERIGRSLSDPILEWVNITVLCCLRILRRLIMKICFKTRGSK